MKIALPIVALVLAGAAAAQPAAVRAPVAAEVCAAEGRAECVLFPGVVYRRLAETGPRPAVVHVVEIDLAGGGLALRMTPADRSGFLEHVARATSEHVGTTGALVAVNASYFLPFRGGSPAGDDFHPPAGGAAYVSGFSMAGGKETSPVDYQTDRRITSIVCFSPHRVAIFPGQACEPGFAEAVAAGPHLLTAGHPAPRPWWMPAPQPGAEPRGGPRTAIGVDQSGRRVWLVVVDGRQPGHSEGFDHDRLVMLFQRLGAHDAMSLDGGGSSTLAVAGARAPVVLNRPIHTGVPGRERPVANHIGLYRIEAP